MTVRYAGARDSPVLEEVLLDKIRDNPFQPRGRFSRRGIKLLAKNISQRGLLHPILVVRDKDRFILVSGHRRLRAFRMLRRKVIPAIVRPRATNRDLVFDLYIENALRRDFAAVEKARAIFQAINMVSCVKGDMFMALSLIAGVKDRKDRGGPGKFRRRRMQSVTSEHLADAERILALLQVSENTAVSYLRLLFLPKFIQNRIESAHDDTNVAAERRRNGIITVKQGYELSRIADPDLQRRLYSRIIQNGWDWRTLRVVVDELLSSGKAQQLTVGPLANRVKPGDIDRLRKLSSQCFELGNRLWSYRQNHLPFLRMTLDIRVWRASLTQLKKSSEYLADAADRQLLGEKEYEKRKKGLAEDFKFDVQIRRESRARSDCRITVPRKLMRDMKVGPGDVLRIKCKVIQRKAGGND